MTEEQNTSPESGGKETPVVSRGFKVTIIIFMVLILIILMIPMIPGTYTQNVCPICGKENVIRSKIGIEYSDRINETELSKWYKENNLSSHTCQWVLKSWASRSSMNLKGKTNPGILNHLRLLKRMEKHVDEGTFNQLLKELNTIGGNTDKANEFADGLLVRLLGEIKDCVDEKTYNELLEELEAVKGDRKRTDVFADKLLRYDWF